MAIRAALLVLLQAGGGVFAQSTALPDHQTAGAAQIHTTVSELVPALTAEDRASLAADGEVTHLYSLPDEPRLAPAFQENILEDIRQIKPRLGVEVLFLAPAVDGSPAAPTVFTTLQSISTMEGIEYYSQSRGYMRTLFHESYVIDHPGTRKRLPDPVWTTVPSQDRLYVYQRDSSFGKNVLQLDYRVEDATIFLTMTNLRPPGRPRDPLLRPRRC